MPEREDTLRPDPGSPRADEPVVEPEAPAAEVEPAGEEPAGGQPVAGAPAGEEPAAGESAGEEPAAGEAAVEEPAAGEPAVEEPAPAEPEDEAARYLELAKRTQADFENYRKRMARENAVAADRGAARLAKELLPALDHLELALKASATDVELTKGFAMVRDELLAALGKAGIQAFSPQGEKFDPNEHEAMAQQPSEEAEPGTVLEVYQRGYRVNGAVLRPARVVVAQ
jgi:molecular chaperone GrpE